MKSHKGNERLLRDRGRERFISSSLRKKKYLLRICRRLRTQTRN